MPDNNSEPWLEYDQRTGNNPPSAIKLAWFLENLPPSAHILDFGGGNGRWAKLIAQKRPDVTIELVDMRANELTANYQQIPNITHFYATTFENFLPQANHFDGIWSKSALFFSKTVDIPNILSNLHHGLKANGIFEFDFISAQPPENPFSIFHPVDKRSMETMLSHAGFRVLQCEELYNHFGRNRIKLPTYLMRCIRD